MTRPKLSKAAQQAKDLMQYKAMDIGTLKEAYMAIDKDGRPKYMASGVIIILRNLSGDVILGPVMITDGLSDATIAAIKADIKATYDMRLALNAIKE